MINGGRVDNRNEENLVVRICTLATELLVLNILTIITFLPVVTAGASLSAMHDCLQQIVRKEEGYISRRFFKAFKMNLKQGTLLWLPYMIIFAGVIVDIFIQVTSPDLLPKYIIIPAGIAAFVAFFSFQWIFPLQARFTGSYFDIMRLAFLLMIARFPRTALMTVVWVVPLSLVNFLPALPLVLMFGFSVPGYIGAKVYAPVLKELEEPDNDTGNKEISNS